MKICVIPARGGSKRIPRKNIKPFHGKPMIAWSIEAAIESRCFDKVIVSTDDCEIAETSQAYGAEVPFLRPAGLANDYATTGDVMQHVGEILEAQFGACLSLCCLYATAPFVKASDLVEAFRLMDSGCVEYVFAATSFEFPIQRALVVDQNLSVGMVEPQHQFTRSQDLEPRFHDAGQFYWGRSEAFVQRRPFFTERSRAFLIPRHRVQDIDSHEDWERAELMMQVLES